MDIAYIVVLITIVLDLCMQCQLAKALNIDAKYVVLAENMLIYIYILSLIS